MIINVPIKEDHLFANIRTVFAANAHENFPLVEKAFPKRQELTAQVEQIGGFETRKVGQQGFLGFVDLLLQRFNDQKLLVYNVVEYHVQ